MEKLKIEKFQKPEWLLASTDSLKVYGGNVPSQCGTDCTVTDNGDGTWNRDCGDSSTD